MFFTANLFLPINPMLERLQTLVLKQPYYHTLSFLIEMHLVVIILFKAEFLFLQFLKGP